MNNLNRGMGVRRLLGVGTGSDDEEPRRSAVTGTVATFPGARNAGTDNAHESADDRPHARPQDWPGRRPS